MVSLALKFCLMCFLLTITPLVWIWLMIDYPRLKRSALIEPLNIPPARTRSDHIFAMVREIIFFIALPLVALVGMFLCVLTDDPDTRDNGDVTHRH